MKGDKFGKNTYGISSKYKRRKNNKRLRNRIIIVATGVLALAVLAVGITLLVNLISSGISQLGANEPTTAPVTTVPATEPTTADPYPKPIVQDNNSKITTVDDIYVWQGKAFEKFTGTQESAVNYAKTVSELKTALGDGVTVYNMVIPTAVEFGLPDRLKQQIATVSQADYIKKVYSSYTADVKSVNCYANLSAGANEYIFYNTDDLWTSLGAYKAYLSFADLASLKPVRLEDCTKKTIKDYSGVFANNYDFEELSKNLDTIDYYELKNKTSAYIINSDGEKENASVYDSEATNESVFLGGSNPLFVMKSDCKTGKKLAVVKEYYGNTFTPYLAANYDETHVIDYRKWSGSLKDYCKQNGITDVLILNSTKFACEAERLGQLKAIK